MERNAAREYCSVVYPEAKIGKTVFNPVGNGYETTVYLGDETTWIGVSLAHDTIYDPYRKEVFLQETGVAEILLGLTRTYNHFFSCSVGWLCRDPMTPVVSLRMDDDDRENASLPDEEQIKERIAPIVIDFVTQVEEKIPVESINIWYYHPDFDPDERGKTWRVMSIPLNHDGPRTKALLDSAEFVVR